MADARNAGAATMWEAFVRASGAAAAPLPQIVAFAEGAGAHVVDELASLVRRGIKRATTSLERCYTEDGEPYPVAGSYLLVVDSTGNAVCIARTTSVETRPFHAVDAEFAWTEGEGDRSLAYWQAAHRTFFEREALENGFTFDDGSAVVLQRFDVVWPAPEIA
jgi:uncharacterized protein YhfF